jgi:hypothetical protein
LLALEEFINEGADWEKYNSFSKILFKSTKTKEIGGSEYKTV